MRDIRYAVRALWRHKSFAIAAIVTLAIGLGANTALFGFGGGALRPLAVPDADRLVSIAAETKDDESGGFQYAFSTEVLKDIQQRATSFSDVFGVMPRFGGLAANGKASQLFFAAVSDNYFASLRITPEVGRFFTAAAGSPVPVVLGYSYWKNQFGGRADAIGTPVRVDGSPAVIAAVVPKTFRGPLVAVELDAYVAIDDLGALDPDVKTWLYHNRKARAVEVFGRLNPGVTVAAADVEMKALLENLGREHPETDAGVSARVVPEPLSRPLPMRVVSEIIPLVEFFGLALSALVVLIACLNVANLMLVRATQREREMAVRAALGATRLQLVRGMIAEGLLISSLGGILGAIVGQWVLRAFVARMDVGADLPIAFDVQFDWRVFVYSLVAAMLSGTAIGFWPAWRASRADARAALHDGGKGGSDGVDRQRLRRVLVVGQIAGSLALLIVAALFVRSLVAAQQIDLGFDAAHLITVRLDPRQIGYDESRTNEFYKELIRRVSAWPEVASASQAFNVPMSYLLGGGAFYVEGQPLPASGQPPVTFLNHVGHGYFDTMQIPIVRGRAFVEDDELDRSTTRRYAIVNETMAAKVWPGQDPIGKTLRIFGPAEPLLQVVGVARDSKYVLVFEAPRPFLYLPVERDDSLRTLHVRTHGNPAVLAPRLEREIASMAPDMPMSDLRTMSQSLSGIFGYLLFRLGAIQGGGMGLIGLTLAMVGVYGVVSFGASLRTREVGIRMALGAEASDVLWLILGQGVTLVAIGLVVGLSAAVMMSRLLARFLPLVDATDWVTFGTTAVTLGALALLACYIPARRATKVPPMTALRHE